MGIYGLAKRGLPFGRTAHWYYGQLVIQPLGPMINVSYCSDIVFFICIHDYCGGLSRMFECILMNANLYNGSQAAS